MRRLLPLFSAVLLLFSLAGCGGGGESAGYGPETGEAVSPTGLLTGLVAECGSHTLTLVEKNGQSHTISIAQAGEEALSAVQMGATVTVQYRGELEGEMLPSLYSAQAAPSFLPEGIGPGVLAEGMGRAYEIFCTLEEEEKLAQLLLVSGISSPEDLSLPDTASPQVQGETVEKSPGGQNHSLGGVLLGEEAFYDLNKKAARRMLQSFTQGEGIPLLVAVEEEGGSYAPVSGSLASAPFASPKEIYGRGGMVALAKDTAQRAAWLKDLGIQVNLAPVADLASREEAFLFERSMGLSGAETAEAIATQVKAYGAAGTGCVLRHFPGLGNLEDPSQTAVVDTRSYQQFLREDLLPFRAGVEAGAPCVMLSHSRVLCMDGQRPASLSPAVCRLLRDNLTFDGVIMTDNLDVPSLKQREGEVHPAVEALLAGCDLLLVEDWQGALTALTDAYRSGEISQQRLDAACLRVLAWKGCMGLLEK